MMVLLNCITIHRKLNQKVSSYRYTYGAMLPTRIKIIFFNFSSKSVFRPSGMLGLRPAVSFGRDILGNDSPVNDWNFHHLFLVLRVLISFCEIVLWSWLRYVSLSSWCFIVWC